MVRTAAMQEGVGMPKLVDAVIAGVGLFASLAMLGVLELHFDAEFFATPMMASGIIFFAPYHPPSPSGFLVCTAGSATLAAAALAASSAQDWTRAACAGAAAGALLVWYKETGKIHPPAAALSILMADAVAHEIAASTFSSWASSLSFVLFPWLTGHAVLWLSAVLVSRVREEARREFGLAAVPTPGGTHGQKLSDAFRHFDTSNSGTLDVFELKVAMRRVAGIDLPLAQCQQHIDNFDANGDGVIDYEEFESIFGHVF